jgi:hypothetical protein
MVAVTPVRLKSRTGVFLRMGETANGRIGVLRAPTTQVLSVRSSVGMSSCSSDGRGRPLGSPKHLYAHTPKRPRIRCT